MPQFKVAKTDNITKLTNKAKEEDKLYIYKETNKLGRLYFDFSDGTRIEFGASDNIYNTNQKLTTAVVTINIANITKYNSDNTYSTVTIDDISLNELVSAGQSLYSIRAINRNTKVLTLRRIYSQKDLTWNDYY